MAVFGPTSLGPSTTEKSTAEIQSVSVWVRPLSSLLRRRVVLAATLSGGNVHLIQGCNRSWFGAPSHPPPTREEREREHAQREATLSAAPAAHAPMLMLWQRRHAARFCPLLRVVLSDRKSVV